MDPQRLAMQRAHRTLVPSCEHGLVTPAVARLTHSAVPASTLQKVTTAEQAGPSVLDDGTDKTSLQKPLVNLRIFAVVCFADDNSGAPYPSDHIAARVAGANTIFEPAGFRLAFDPADRIDRSSTLLWEDKTPGDIWRNAITRANLAAQHSGHITVFFRDWKEDMDRMVAYGYSGGPNHVVMAKTDGDDADHFAHEVGHFLGLPHTFGGIALTVPDTVGPTDWAAWELELRAQQVKHIRDYVSAIGGDFSRGLEAFDGDSAMQIHDTPADDMGQLIYALNGGDPDGPIGHVDIVVRLSGSFERFDYVLQPDRQNLMSYFGMKPRRLSAGQARVIRAVVDNGGGRRLVKGKAWADSTQGQDELSPAAVSWGPGHLLVAARGERGRVFTRVLDTSSGSWWPDGLRWSDIGGNAVGSPVGVSWQPGRVDLFATMRDGHVRNKVWEGSRESWWPGHTDWADLGGSVVGPPAALSWGPGHLFVAARAANGQILTKTWDAESGWWPGQTDWLSVGGNMVGAPALVSWMPGRIDMVATDVNGHVKSKVWEKDRGDWWPSRTGWSDLGGTMLGPPAALSWGPGRLDVFARGTDGRAYNKVWEASRGGWWPGQTEWADVGAPEPAPPGTADGEGGTSILDGPVDKVVAAGELPAIGGGAVASSLAAVARQPGQLDLVVRARSGRLYNKVWSAEGWWPGQTDWADLGGETVGVPVVVSSDPGRLDIIARHFTGAVVHRHWDQKGGAWHPDNPPWDILGRPWV